MISVSKTPDDPTWPVCAPPGCELLYVSWTVWNQREAGPSANVTASLAGALVAGGAAAFLGAPPRPAAARATEWVPTGPGSWMTERAPSTTLRQLGMARVVPITCTIDAAKARMLFDQAGFGWSQRGQCVFLFGLEGLPHSVDASAILHALEAEPPQPLPDYCHGYLRPATDGDFAEFAIRNAERKRLFLDAIAS